MVRQVLRDPMKMKSCPKLIKSRIIEYTALIVSREKIKEGVMELPRLLDIGYTKGWERGCDICLINDMIQYGLCNYDKYVVNDSVDYVLTHRMNLKDEQKLQFVKSRCNFILKCLLLQKDK